jgi:hypothetical protein
MPHDQAPRLSRMPAHGWDAELPASVTGWGREFLIRPNPRFHVATIHYLGLPSSHQKPMSISRYIVVAAVKFSRASSDLPVRR